MIILCKRYGNHANRLMQNVHLEIFCKENGIRYINADFEDMVPFFNGTKSVCFAKALRRLSKVVPSAIKISQHEVELGDIKKQFTGGGIHFVSGFGYRSYNLIEKYHDFVTLKYGIKEGIKDKQLLSIINEKRSEGKLLVGVHIRRTDYKDYLNGKYYYSLDFYKQIIKRLAELIGERNVYFVLFSDETVQIDLPNCTQSHGTWYQDLDSMSNCDYLIGPPSTFSCWASYMGNVPQYFIKDTERTIQLTDFQVSSKL